MGPEAVAWLVLGTITVVAGARAHRSRRALQVGRWAVGALFVLGGALVNAWYLATGTDYAAFADASYLPFVRDTWAAVVAPHQEFWIGLLIAFEAIAGGLVLSGGRRATVGLVSLLAFHVLLLPFGWFLYAWSLPMLAGIGLLLRAHLREQADSGTPGTGGGRGRGRASPAPVGAVGGAPWTSDEEA